MIAAGFARRCAGGDHPADHVASRQYGVDGMFDDVDDERAHGRDERIGVQAFSEELEFTWRLMKVLAGGEGR